MNRLLRRWRKDMDRRMTIMVIPHGTASPRQISFSAPFLAFLFIAWTGVTGWLRASQNTERWRYSQHSLLSPANAWAMESVSHSISILSKRRCSASAGDRRATSRILLV